MCVSPKRYTLELTADFFNLTNRGNVYSNPETIPNSTISLAGCVARPAPVEAANFFFCCAGDCPPSLAGLNRGFSRLCQGTPFKSCLSRITRSGGKPQQGAKSHGGEGLNHEAFAYSIFLTVMLEC